MRFLAATSLNCYEKGKLVEHHEKTGTFEQIFYKREIHEESLAHDVEPQPRHDPSHEEHRRS